MHTAPFDLSEEAAGTLAASLVLEPVGLNEDTTPCSSIEGRGDFDGDGLSALALSGRGNSPGGNYSGGVYIAAVRAAHGTLAIAGATSGAYFSRSIAFALFLRSLGSPSTRV